MIAMRLSQEAPANAERRARAQRVKLTLQCGDRGARLEVRDDGRGFQAGPPRDDIAEGGYGLTAIREWMQGTSCRQACRAPLAVTGFACTLGSLFWLARRSPVAARSGNSRYPSASLVSATPPSRHPCRRPRYATSRSRSQGAGSGGCNAIRQRGAVLGDASIAAVTQAGLKTDLPAIATAPRIHEAYATAME